MPAGSTQSLIVGAGPYGLSLAAFCVQRNVDHLLVGEPMAFWRRHMPAGMLLRSTSDWHLDPDGSHTLEAYFRRSDSTRRRTDPIALVDYLGYCGWFAREKRVHAVPAHVQTIGRDEQGPSRFIARFEDGSELRAERVVIATGFGACAHVSDAHAQLFAGHGFSHAHDMADLSSVQHRSVLIIGGRQSAFEWAALAAESGAASVHVCYRHATPSFGPADWSWVDPLLDRLDACPGWYRGLAEEEKTGIAQHMWSLGRANLEPWLAARIARPEIRLWPGNEVAAVEPGGPGVAAVFLRGGQQIQAHQVILATGYKTDVKRLDFLRRGGLLDELTVEDGYPVLNDSFESSVSGLYFTNRFATRDFGGFFDFTAGCRVGARIIGTSLLQRKEA